VIAPAVGLDHQAEVGPEEVDLELVDYDFSERDAEAGRKISIPEPGPVVEADPRTPQRRMATDADVDNPRRLLA